MNCVRWDPTGARLATASDDKTAKAIDAKTGKVIHNSTTPDQSKILMSAYLMNLHLIARVCLLSVLPLKGYSQERKNHRRERSLID